VTTVDTRVGLRNGEPFRVSVSLLSDWSCGTGTGRHGSVDRRVERDADGLPMLRGKTLAGMLRDGAEIVATGLDNGDPSRWHRWVEVVFGGQPGVVWRDVPLGDRAERGPAPAALQARPLRLAEAVRSGIAKLGERDRGVVSDALVLLRPGVSIDPATGIARDDMFRVEEWASAGLTVEADWRLELPGLGPGAPVPWEAELLLLAAARMVDAVGGKRRRGAGRCEVSIAVPGGPGRLDALLDRVDEAGEPPRHRPAAERGAVRVGAAQPAQPLVHRCDLRITALTPLLAAKRTVGNLVSTEWFVPGTSLMPLVANAIGARATELITGGRLVVTDATLEIEGQRSLPMPRALQIDKDADGSELVNVLRVPQTGRRLKPKSGFCAIARDSMMDGIVVDTPQPVAYAHAVIDDERQRPTEESGGLFVYEAMAAGTVLRAEVWLPTDHDGLDESPLSGERRLGYSKKDDYGQVIIDVLAPQPRPHPRPSPQGAPGPQGELVVWLVSDVLLRGDAGQATADVGRFASVLSGALGVGLTLPPATDETASALVATRRMESWQMRWSLPRPSLTGLAAGTVVRFHVDATPDDEACRRVEANGIGERTAEGYGRILLQPALLDLPSIPIRSITPMVHQPTASPAAPADLVTELLVRGWRRELRRVASARARDPHVRRELLPDKATSAQLGILRLLADRFAMSGDPTAMLSWIRSAQTRRATAWPPAQLNLLKRLAEQREDLWRLLDCQPPSDIRPRLYPHALASLLAEVARSKTLAREVPT
jgi:CRISPR-associated protein Csx10